MGHRAGVKTRDAADAPEQPRASTSNTMTPITAPAARLVPQTLVLWGRRSNVGQLYGDVLTIWHEAASTVRGSALESGHYPAEEAPAAVAEAFERFFV